MDLELLFMIDWVLHLHNSVDQFSLQSVVLESGNVSTLDLVIRPRQ